MSNGTKVASVSPDNLGKQSGTREVSKVTEFSRFLEKLKPQMSLALPKHLSADRMARIVLTEFSKTPALQSCSMNSIAACIMTASQLGLEIGVGGQAYMIPYKGVATLVPGWKGLVDLVSRAGRASVWTGAVFDGDEFDWELGSEPFLRHKPGGENDPDLMTHVYAIGKVNGSETPVIECWTNDRVRKHFERNVIPSLKSNHYANKHWEMYARKVVLLQVLKYMPQSFELQAAVEVSHASESGTPVTIDASFVAIESGDEVLANSPQDQ